MPGTVFRGAHTTKVSVLEKFGHFSPDLSIDACVGVCALPVDEISVLRIVPREGGVD